MSASFPEEGKTPVDRSAAKGVGYLPTLDGWRALAILCVMVAHGQVFLPWPVVRHIFDMAGQRGVELFFALSGLLISGLLLREEERTGGISLRGFYLRRLFRIQPAAFTYLFFIAVASIVGFVPQFWSGIFGAVFMVRNFWPKNIGPGYWFTSHFWTLSVEEHFYLFLPAFLVVFRRRRLLLLISMFVLQAVWIVQVMHHPVLQQFGQNYPLRTDIRFGPILLGCVAAFLLNLPQWKERAVQLLPPWVAVMYCAIVFWRLETHHSTYDGILLSTVYPLLLVSTLLHPQSFLGRFLEWSPLRFVGRISFSLYLWQQFFFIWDSPPLPGQFRSHWAVCGVLTFVCATVSYYWVEQPMMRLGHRVGARYRRPARMEATV
ncbi:MAG: acyltransferase [Terriglobus sp.]